MQAFSALVELFRYFATWVPYPLKVLPVQRAIKFRTVSWFLVSRREWWMTFRVWTSPVPSPEMMLPGFYWYIPAITDVIVFSAVDDFYTIAPRYALTSDNKTVTVRSILTCKITGHIWAATRCESIEEAIVSQGILAQTQVIAAHSSEAMASNLNDELEQVAQNALGKYGVKVLAAAMEVGTAKIRHHVGLTDAFPPVEL